MPCEVSSGPVEFQEIIFTNFPVHEREAVAIVFLLRRFHSFHDGRNFELVTGNAALVVLFGEKITSILT